MVVHEDAGVSIPLEGGLADAPQKLDALYRFSRPHTMLGTFISVCSVSALAVVSYKLSSTLITAVLSYVDVRLALLRH